MSLPNRFYEEYIPISIEQVDACLNYLRQAVRDLGGELAITAKFPDLLELSIESVKAISD